MVVINMNPTWHLCFQDVDGRWRLGCGNDPFNPHVTKSCADVTCRSCKRSKRFKYWEPMQRLANPLREEKK